MLPSSPRHPLPEAPCPDLQETPSAPDPEETGAGLWASCLEGLEGATLGTGSWSDPGGPEASLLPALPELGDRFQQADLLGEGSSARVWRAWDSLLERWVALKVLKAESSAVLREARAQAQVEHPNVCRIYEAGKGYIVMELVDGPNLARLAPDLDIPARIELVREVAQGVHAAHRRGLVHLDLKPGNILVQRGEDGSLRPVVGDFGMVRAGRRPGGSCPMGTPPFTSPEQLGGNPAHLSPRSDVHALGVMLYVLLAGALPFAAADMPALLEAIRSARPIPLRRRRPDLAEDLERIVERCMEKDPRERYPSARALAEDLGRFLRHEPVEAMGRGWTYRLGKWYRRRRRLAWGLGLGGILTVAGGALALSRIAYASERAEWDAHFAKQVETLRRHLDRTYRLPPHNIDLELAEARAMRDAIRQETARQGRAAQGPGQLALGQAIYHLDPGDPEALEAFRTAWKLGLRTETARHWLSLALLQEYRKAVSAAGSQSDAAKVAALRAEARARFLEPARAMLAGRGSEDQTRLQHLVEMAQAETGDRSVSVRLAQAFRARFPNDLDALFELADITVVLAREEAQRETRAAQEGAGGAPAPRWGEGEVLLLEALRITPSHPQVYRRLAELCLEREARPGTALPLRRELLEQSRRWLDGGLAVSPSNPDLWRVRIRHQVRLLTLRLSQGEDPGPAARELRERFADAARHPDPSILKQVAPWQPMALRAAAAHDLPLPFDLGALLSGRDLSALPEPYWWLVNARYQMETGQDAGFALETAARQSAAHPGPWMAGFSLALARAEWARIQGRDPAPHLAEAQAIFRNRPPSSTPDQAQELELARHRALGLDAPGAWAELEAVLARQEPDILASLRGLPASIAFLQGRLALARHALARQEDPRPALEKLRPWLKGRLAKGRTSGRADLEAGLAEVELLLGRAAGPKGMGACQEGLRACARALDAFRPPTAEERRRGGSHRAVLGGVPPLQSGRILALRGELLLTLAEGTPGERLPRARQAREAFREALRRNRNLAPQVEPLERRARALEAGGGRP